MSLIPKQPIKEIDPQLRPFYYLADKMIEKYGLKSGLEITIDSQIPLGVGLGSSSACCVASAAAISGIFEKKSREEILQMAIKAEKTIFPNTSGGDCTVCTYGGLMEYDKENGHSKIEAKPNFELIIANSKIQHSTSEIVSKVKNFKDENEKQFSIICENVSHLINNVLTSLKKNDLEEIGRALLKNQDYLESIGVSNDKLKTMIEIAKQTSYGAKLTGAGGGGCIFAISDGNKTEKTLENLKSNNYECFSVKIDFQGLDTF